VDWGKHARRILERLGEDATYTPKSGGASSTVRGVFQKPYHQALDLIESSSPTFGCMAEDVPNLAHGDTFVIGGATYKAQGTERDPVSGLVNIRLEAQ
jgi:hypothetical protein